MPVVGINDVENYKFQGDFGFLSLPDDKDVAKVRFYFDYTNFFIKYFMKSLKKIVFYANLSV